MKNILRKYLVQKLVLLLFDYYKFTYYGLTKYKDDERLSASEK